MYFKSKQKQTLIELKNKIEKIIGIPIHLKNNIEITNQQYNKIYNFLVTFFKELEDLPTDVLQKFNIQIGVTKDKTKVYTLIIPSPELVKTLGPDILKLSYGIVVTKNGIVHALTDAGTRKTDIEVVMEKIKKEIKELSRIEKIIKAYMKAFQRMKLDYETYFEE